MNRINKTLTERLKKRTTVFLSDDWLPAIFLPGLMMFIFWCFAGFGLLDTNKSLATFTFILAAVLGFVSSVIGGVAHNYFRKAFDLDKEDLEISIRHRNYAIGRIIHSLLIVIAMIIPIYLGLFLTSKLFISAILILFVEAVISFVSAAKIADYELNAKQSPLVNRIDVGFRILSPILMIVTGKFLAETVDEGGFVMWSISGLIATLLLPFLFSSIFIAKQHWKV